MYEQFWDASGVVAQYVAGLRAIDLRGCPSDFQKAYLRHIQAWESLQNQMASNQGLSGFLKGFFTLGLSASRRNCRAGGRGQGR